MALITQSPRGVQDVLPSEIYRWHTIEDRMKCICGKHGYKEIRVPTFEHTELFARGVGDTTDVVNKEMYTFDDRGGRSITLRPEGTAGVVRALIQGGVLAGTLPVRTYYLMPCYRYEKPQAGRLREFHQLGIELFGAERPDADFEVIMTAREILSSFGLGRVRAEINSIGCKNCRPIYHEALKEYFEARRGDLCETCQSRLDRNPMRILDCKSPICQEIAAGAPVTLDYLCDDCRDHFERFKGMLDAANAEYTVNPRVVRGLDYYSRTVFELVHEGAGAQGVVCGGGRYDGLVEMLGGNPTPAVGFGMGIERLLNVMDAEGIVIPEPAGPDVFVCTLGNASRDFVRTLVYELKAKGISAQYDLNDRGLKAQMKYADKIGARFTAVIGDSELERGACVIRSMAEKTETESALTAESIIQIIK